MTTSGNAELVTMCGPRDPYTGKIGVLEEGALADVILVDGNPYKEGAPGVVKEGAYADLLLVDGNPLENLDLVADPDKNFAVIMKDGEIYKNTIK